jgi:hypothetical protein
MGPGVRKVAARCPVAGPASPLPLAGQRQCPVRRSFDESRHSPDPREHARPICRGRLHVPQLSEPVSLDVPTAVVGQPAVHSRGSIMRLSGSLVGLDQPRSCARSTPPGHLQSTPGDLCTSSAEEAARLDEIASALGELLRPQAGLRSSPGRLLGPLLVAPAPHAMQCPTGEHPRALDRAVLLGFRPPSGAPSHTASSQRWPSPPPCGTLHVDRQRG